MSFKQVIAITHRMGLQIIRSKWTIPYLVLFPIFFIALYWFGFSASPIGTTPTFLLGVVNNDEGLSDSIQKLFQNETIMGNESLSQYHSPEVLTQGFGVEFINLLNTSTYSNQTNSPKIFDVTLFSSVDEAEDELLKRDIDILIVIPSRFSNASLAIFNSYWKNAFGFYFHEILQELYPEVPSLPTNITESIQIKGDDTYINFRHAKSVIDTFISGYQDLTYYFSGPGGSITLAMNNEYQVSIPQYSLFELTTPGLFAFGILVQPSLLSLLLCMEFRPKNKTIDLIWVSPCSGTHYILGSFLIQVPVMLAQTFILFFASILFGFTPQGNLFLGMIISLSIFPFSSALLYLTTAFISNEDIAGTVLGFGGPLLSFMSGAFIAVPQIILFPNIFPTASGYNRDFLIWDLMPLTHSVTALRQGLLYDFNIWQVLPDVLFSILLGIIYLLVAMLIFYYMRFKRSG
jgi:hypothetical protein